MASDVSKFTHCLTHITGNAIHAADYMILVHRTCKRPHIHYTLIQPCQKMFHPLMGDRFSVRVIRQPTSGIKLPAVDHTVCRMWQCTSISVCLRTVYELFVHWWPMCSHSNQLSDQIFTLFCDEGKKQGDLSATITQNLCLRIKRGGKYSGTSWMYGEPPIR